MKLSLLLEAKKIEVDKLNIDELTDLVVEWAIHNAVERVEEEIADVNEELDLEEAVDMIASNAYEASKEIYSTIGRLPRDKVMKPFKKLYPKLYNTIAKKH